MILDFEDTDTPAKFEADLCIIGAGAAGLTIAAELNGANNRVLLVESGNFDFDVTTQNLYDVENVGIARQPTIQQRLRMVGGTTNHWDGRCAPFDPIDFEQRDWLPYSGWPITRQDLDPYYVRAHTVCDMQTTMQNAAVARECRLPRLAFDPDKFVLHTWQFSPPTRFAKKYRQTLEQSTNITTLLHANVTTIETDPNDSHIEHLQISTLAGRKGEIRARIYVLACGGIENPRLLLASTTHRPQGIGNTYDVVGRFFMEHLRTKYVAVPLQDDYVLRATFNDCMTGKGDFLAGIRVSDTLQRAQKIGNFGVMSYTEGGEASPTNSAFRLAGQLSKGKLPENFGQDVLNVLSDLNSIIVNVRRHVLMPGSETIEKALFALVCESEQAPNPNSRITLSEHRDAIGSPQAKVDWQLSEFDLHTTQVAVTTLANQLAAKFNARIRIPEWLSSPYDNWSEQFRDVSHHMGATRMSDTPQQGVVNADCRMHAVNNLYIGGSSVFATGGHSNPTLTIVALALKLADHLKIQLKTAA